MNKKTVVQLSLLLTIGFIFLVIFFKYFNKNEDTRKTNISEKKIIRITDILLRDVQFKKNKILLYFFNDGTIEKKYINN